MNWQFGTLPDLEPDFITSDNPVLLVVPPGDLVGLAHPEIDVKLSLSRRVVAIANWDGKPGYGLLAEGAANQINEETMRRAKRFLFASSKSDKLLKRAKELYNTGPKIRVRRVKMGQGLAIIPEYR